MTQARQIVNLLKAHESVGLPRNEQWCEVMKEAVRLIDDLSPSEPRLAPILGALQLADRFFLAGDWEAFQRQIIQIEQMMNERRPVGNSDGLALAGRGRS